MPFDKDPMAALMARGVYPLSDHTQPDMADGGRMVADPNLYQAGGTVKKGFKKAKEFLKQEMFHGGNYKKGEEITQPLYMTPDRRMAESYVDPSRIPGSTLQSLRPDVTNPAPERLVQAAIRRHVPENQYMGYTPATAFDPNLHEAESIQALIDELTRRGYDSAIAHDIGMGPNITPSPALVAFPGAKAYKDGGAAFGVFPQMKPRRSGKSDIGEEMYKSAFVPEDMLDIALMLAPFGKAGKLLGAGAAALSPMEAEAGKVKTGVNLARRSLFGLRPTQEMKGRELVPLEKMREELARAERAAPKVEQKTTTVTPSPNAPKVEETLKSVAETPVSRRTVLKSASGQVMRHALPGMDELSQLANPVQSVVQQAAPASLDALVPGLMAKALKMGMSEEEAVKFVQSQLPRASDKMDLGVMHYLMENPHEFASNPSFSGASRLGVMRDILQQPSDASPFSVRGAIRNVRRENPEAYDYMRDIARDIQEYGLEP